MMISQKNTVFVLQTEDDKVYQVRALCKHCTRYVIYILKILHTVPVGNNEMEVKNKDK